MPKIIKPLSPKTVDNAKPRDKLYKLRDGDGLYLEVTPKGGKYWKFEFRFDGKRPKYSIGAFPDITLANARKIQLELRSLISQGINPVEQKKASKVSKKVEAERNLNTFEKVARDRLEKVKENNKISETHYKRTLNAFINDAFPYIGSKLIDEITPPDIVSLLRIMDDRDARESARKLFYSISKTFKWAVANGKASRSPASDIDLGELLGEKSKKHYPTITDENGIRGLLNAIDEYSGDFTTRQALRMLPYVFVRPFNIRHAEWCEINLKDKQWIIPASKMKTKQELIVPLTDSVIQIIEETKLLTGDSKYLFPSVRSKISVMSENTLNSALRRLGYTKDEMVSHGFRAMFSTVAHEKSPFEHDVIEIQLAHSVGNSVSRAYMRSKYLDKRVELMQWWSNYLDNLKTNNDH